MIIHIQCDTCEETFTEHDFTQEELDEENVFPDQNGLYHLPACEECK